MHPIRKNCRIILLIPATLVLVGACNPSTLRPDPSAVSDDSSSPDDAPMTITLSSPAFAEGAAIPVQYAGDGSDVSPPLEWTGVPDAAVEFALIMDDPDAPTDEPWVHWVIYNIPVSAAALPEDVSKIAEPAEVAGAGQGANSWGDVGYGGPAPPEGDGVHRYRFKLYALDTALSISGTPTKDDLLTAMAGITIARGQLIGTYER